MRVRVIVRAVLTPVRAIDRAVLTPVRAIDRAAAHRVGGEMHPADALLAPVLSAVVPGPMAQHPAVRRGAPEVQMVLGHAVPVRHRRAVRRAGRARQIDLG